MTEGTVRLAQCLRCQREPERFGMNVFRVRCPSCDAMTPCFDVSVDADAAWNRMMAAETCDQFNARMEPLRAAVACMAGPTIDTAKNDARSLLSALGDELQNAINRLPGAGAPNSFHPSTLAVCVMRDAVKAVLAKKP